MLGNFESALVAWQQGYIATEPLAMYNLGVANLSGIGMQPDWEQGCLILLQAIAAYEQAAQPQANKKDTKAPPPKVPSLKIFFSP